MNTNARVGVPRETNALSPKNPINGPASTAPTTATGAATKHISSTLRRRKPTNAAKSRENSSVAVDSVDLRNKNATTAVVPAIVQANPYTPTSEWVLSRDRITPSARQYRIPITMDAI